MNEYEIGKTKFGFPCRIFLGMKYVKLNNGYYISTTSRMLLSHAIWNHNHPENPIRSGEVIHHKNGIRDDDFIGNYEKLKKSKHSSNHQRGINNSMAGKVGRFRQKNCDWPECKERHRRGGFCEKHSAVIKYWNKKGINQVSEIIKIAYRPVNEIRKRNRLGMFT